jgi:hypothetical protein
MALWDGKPVYDRVLELLAQRKKAYVKFNAARDSIVDLMRPDLGSDTTPDGDGSFFGDQIYDGIGSWAVGVMARGFQGGLVSADADWFSHDMEDDRLDDVKVLSEWQQEIDSHMSKVYQKSNFYRVLPRFTKDGVSIGSPVMFVEEEDILTGEIAFKPQHYKKVYLFYNGNNKLEGVIIKDDTWTIKQISDKFAQSAEEQKAKLSTSINNEIGNGKYYTERTIIRAVFKSDNPVWDVEGFKRPEGDGEWLSVYFEEKTEEDRKNTPLLTEQYFSRPFVVWDYDKHEDESVSRTPAFDAIHDVLAQQQESLDLAENRKLKNNPPMAVLEDHRNIVDFTPQGITPIASGDWNMLPKAIDMVGDIQLTRENLEFNAEKVKRWFHTADFVKFTDLTNTLRQQPSATQIIKIAAELATQVNPGIASYTTGFLKDVDTRMIDIEVRAGRGPFHPLRMQEIADVIRAHTGEEVSSISVVPVFIGQLARAQKVKAELDPILEGLGVGSEMFQIWPNLKHAIDEHGTLQDALKVMNFPMDRFKSKDDYNEIVERIQAAEAAALKQQQTLEMLKASPAVQGPVDETSIMSQVQGAG